MPDCFTVALHHHGVFHNGDYITGRLNYIDYVSVRQFNLFELASMLVRVGYDRNTICESSYCHPKFNDACVGIQVGHPTHSLIEDEDVPRFLEAATTTPRLIHVYALELTRADALARQKKDQAAFFYEFLRPKSTGVVIEEMEETPKVVPKPKPRKKAKVIPKDNPQTPLLEWYGRDIEFEDYLVDSLVKAREEWRKKDIENEAVIKNPMDEFIVVKDDSQVVSEEQQAARATGGGDAMMKEANDAMMKEANDAMTKEDAFEVDVVHEVLSVEVDISTYCFGN